MNTLRFSHKLLMLAFILVLFVSGCKSSKKAMQASNAANEKAKLEKEAALRKQKQQEEEDARKKAAEAEERARLAAAAKPVEKTIEPTVSNETRLRQYMEAIAGSGNVTSANNTINEALALFASPQTPVLIVISEENGRKDYDKPTTILNYLNYLKDQRKNINSVGDLKLDATGKITEVELKKNF